MIAFVSAIAILGVAFWVRLKPNPTCAKAAAQYERARRQLETFDGGQPRRTRSGVPLSIDQQDNEQKDNIDEGQRLGHAFRDAEDLEDIACVGKDRMRNGRL